MGNAHSGSARVVKKPSNSCKRKRGLCTCIKVQKDSQERSRSAQFRSTTGPVYRTRNPLSPSKNDRLRELKIQMLPVAVAQSVAVVQKPRNSFSSADNEACPPSPSPPISPRDTPNRSVHRYSYNVALQNGHSGEVFLGADYKTGQKVVVKLVKPSKTKCFETEVAALSALKHRNIIKLVGKPQKNVAIGNTQIRTPTGTAHVLALEYAAAGDLYDYLNDKGALNEDEARIFFKQMLAAVKHAHNKNIIHRDIKLENIFITKDGTIKLGDWGLSKCNIGQYDSLRDNGGTVGYFPPEKLNKQYYDGRLADIWALGVTLFSMISGNRPYAEPSKRDLGHVSRIYDPYLRLMIRQDWSAWWQRHQRSLGSGTCSKELMDLVQRMLDTRPTMRISVDEIEKHPWMLKKPAQM